MWSSNNDITQIVTAYLEKFRKGDCENTYFDLTELGAVAIPSLIEAYHSETDACVRELLVEVIWQLREPSMIPFLGEALLDEDESVWKQAIDGLVALASVEAADVLRSARKRKFLRQKDAEEFQGWIDEAISQVENCTRRA